MTARADPADELVDEVDPDDRVLRQVTRREMRAKRLRHRSVFVAVLRGDGRILVHKRSDAKDVWPGMWDLAVGGVVASGEGYDEAARREVAEEVGIVDVAPIPIGGGAYDDADVAVIGRCYRVVTDAEPRYVDGEVVEARWVTFAELDAMLETHPFLPDARALLLPLLR